MQGQKVVPVLIRWTIFWMNPPLAHLDSLWLPPIRLSIQPSLQAFFTQTLGIFFPSTMSNTVFTSVWGWNWGVGQGRRRTTSEEINGVFLGFFLSSSLFMFSLPSEVADRLEHPEIPRSHSPKRPSLLPLCGQYLSHGKWLRISNQVTELWQKKTKRISMNPYIYIDLINVQCCIYL